MRVTVKQVDKVNWEDLIKLNVLPEQQHYVLPVSISLSKAYLKPDDLSAHPYAIMKDEKIVGFFLIKCDPYSSQNYWFEGFMIDKDYQDKGIGTKAVKEALDIVGSKFKNCKAIKVKIEPGNKPAIRVVEKCGMKKTGVYSIGEEVYIGNIPRKAEKRKVPA